MRKILFTLLICSQIGFSQVDLNIDKTISVEEEVDENYTPYEYVSNGVYKYVLTSATYSPHTTKKEEFQEFIKKNNYSYDVLADEYLHGAYSNTTTFVFRLKDSLGNPLISKREAKREILEIKELLDLEIITQGEYDVKAKKLKAIILK